MQAVPLTLLFFLILLLSPATPTPTQRQPHPHTQTLAPTPWPDQFHALLFMNTSNDLSLVDLWYDWPGGRNFNILRHQRGGPPFFDLEWNNGTSFWYTLEEPRSCSTVQLNVGVLRPDWLHGAQYLGRENVDGFLCDVWTKLEFIWYYEDVETKRPVKWIFYTGRTIHVMTYEVGAVLDDASWQAPVYCFQKNDTATEEQQMENPEMFSFDNSASINRNLIRSQRTLSVGSSLSS